MWGSEGLFRMYKLVLKNGVIGLEYLRAAGVILDLVDLVKLIHLIN